MSEIKLIELREWFKEQIEDLILEYNCKYEYYDYEKYWNLGATEALKELQRRLNDI